MADEEEENNAVKRELEQDSKETMEPDLTPDLTQLDGKESFEADNVAKITGASSSNTATEPENESNHQENVGPMEGVSDAQDSAAAVEQVNEQSDGLTEDVQDPASGPGTETDEDPSPDKDKQTVDQINMVPTAELPVEKESPEDSKTPSQTPVESSKDNDQSSGITEMATSSTENQSNASTASTVAGGGKIKPDFVAFTASDNNSDAQVSSAGRKESEFISFTSETMKKACISKLDTLVAQFMQKVPPDDERKRSETEDMEEIDNMSLVDSVFDWVWLNIFD